MKKHREPRSGRLDPGLSMISFILLDYKSLMSILDCISLFERDEQVKLHFFPLFLTEDMILNF